MIGVNAQINVANLKVSEVFLAVVYYDGDNDRLSFKFPDGPDKKEENWAILQRFLCVPERRLTP